MTEVSEDKMLERALAEGISKSQHGKLHVFTYSSILLKECQPMEMKGFAVG